MKRIVICADGTWNIRDQVDQDTHRRHPTNVTKVARAILPQAADGTPQVVYYHDGVGTTGGLDRYTGGAFGQGIEANIRDLYRFIVYNYEAGDELYFFGFSRGAFTVRTLAGFMHKVGLIQKDDDFFVPEIYACYENSKGPGTPEWETAFKRVQDTRPCPPIRFIGVWDTVGALGAPGLLGQLFNKNKYQYHDVGLNPAIQNAYHALAIDERRKPFTPNIWTRPPGWNGTLEQAWFAGVHCNVGGGYSPDGLANEALHWMVEKAERLGLEFDSTYLRYFLPCFNSVLQDSMSLLYKVMGAYVRPIGQHLADGETLHKSVLDRRALAECQYAPENLQAFLQSAGNFKPAVTTRVPTGMPCRPAHAPIAAGLIAAVFGLFSHHAHADSCVFPSEEVTAGVVMRTSATANSAKRGLLRPGESAPLLGDQSAWYKVRTSGNQTAFVSKRWTVLSDCGAPIATAPSAAPAPLLAAGHPVDWWFVFKFNAVTFPGCPAGATPSCPFGGTVKSYVDGQQFVFASSEDAHLKAGTDCAGTTDADPLGATFAAAYTGHSHYITWNDQFKGDPNIPGCGANCDSPWGHSKGMAVWDDSGAGFVLQVSTPSWPGAGNQAHPRQHDGNTLGCVDDNNVKYSQHFFGLRLTHDDLVKVLQGLVNASVGTDPNDPQLASNGGPPDVQTLVRQLGHKSSSAIASIQPLSTGVRLISKPSGLHVPPWQLVSSLLDAVPIRAATWWVAPTIPSTTGTSQVTCWDGTLGPAGAVQIATSGQWQGTSIGLQGLVANGNHAKIGVSLDDHSHLAIFGDLNQQGAVTGSATDCKRSQNGRGGIFFVVQNQALSDDLADLIRGNSAPEN